MMTILHEFRIGENIVKALLATESGQYHSRNNLPNQDNAGINHYEEKLVIAVADGVGSCLHADEGSAKAVFSAKELLFSHILTDDEIKHKIIDTWLEKIEYPVHECNSTLRFAKICNNELIIGAVGDGMTFYSSNSTYYNSNSENFISNYTSALPMINEINIVRFPFEQSVLLMMTDGVANAIDAVRGKELCQYVREGMLKDPVQFENEVKNWIDTLHEINEDDKTIAMILIN